PDELTFPYDDQRFSLVCGFSVFTHLLPADLERYLGESYRVLRLRGRVHATRFLLTPERPQLPGAGPAGYVARNDVTAEWAVAYDEASLRECFRATGFELRVVSYGTWADHGLERAAEGTQDVLVAYRA